MNTDENLYDFATYKDPRVATLPKEQVTGKLKEIFNTTPPTDDDIRAWLNSRDHRFMSMPKSQVVQQGYQLLALPKPSYMGALKSGFNKEPQSGVMSNTGEKALHFIGKNGLEMAGGIAGGSLGGPLAVGAGAGIGSELHSAISEGTGGPINSVQDNIKEALGTAANYTLSEYGMNKISSFFKGLPSYMKNKAAEEVDKLFDVKAVDNIFGKEPGKAILENGIDAPTFKEAAENIQKVIDLHDHHLDAIVNGAKYKKVKLNLNNVIKPIDESISKLKKDPTANKAAIQRLEDLRSDFLGGSDKTEFYDDSLQTWLTQNGQIMHINPKAPKTKSNPLIKMSLQDAIDLKRRIGFQADFKPTVTNPGDNIISPTLRKAYNVANETITKVAPETRKINKNISSLIGARQAALKQAEKGADKTGFSPLLGGAAVASGGMMMGHPIEGLLGGAAVAGAKSVSESMPIRMGVSRGLHKAGASFEDVASGKVAKTLAKMGKGFSKSMAVQAEINDLVKKGLNQISPNSK